MKVSFVKFVLFDECVYCKWIVYCICVIIYFFKYWCCYFVGLGGGGDLLVEVIVDIGIDFVVVVVGI